MSSGSFILTVVKLGIIFIIIAILVSLLLWVISDDARNLFRRLYNLIKNKLKK